MSCEPIDATAACTCADEHAPATVAAGVMPPSCDGAWRNILRTFAHAVTTDDRLAAVADKLVQHVVQACAASAASLLVTDRTSGRLAPLARAGGTACDATSRLQWPLDLGQRGAGVIIVERVGRAGSFARHDAAFGAVLAEALALAIERRELELEQSRAMEALSQRVQDAQAKLMQSDRLASIGQLAAGVAHEINNPIGYVFSNLSALERYLGDLWVVIGEYETCESSLSAEHRAGIAARKAEVDLDFVRDDIFSLMNESKEGITRVKKIVQDLKDFSHVGAEDEWQWADVRTGLESTLNIVHNELKYKARVVKEYGDVPEIECLPFQLNQVFMNLLVNAAHAISADGVISVRTSCSGGEICVEVQDNGSGIAPEHRARIFDPFFTTKPVGQGTGLGLSLSYGIVRKHNGRIEVSSELGVGTTFRVVLPVRRPEPRT